MNPRATALPVIAAALVAAVVGVQVAHGGAEFAPAQAADPCAPRAVEPVSEGIDALAEQLVLLGLDGAACRLEVSREALVLRLAGPARRTDAEVDAVRAGLREAVERLDRAGRLPPASALAEEALAAGEVPALVGTALRALPDGFIDDRLPTADVLRRTIDDLDIRTLLAEVENPAQVQALVRGAVIDAAIAEFLAGLPNPFS